jgi:hypothetical protein
VCHETIGEQNIMNIGIIGVGKVGGGLGKLRVRATHQVFFLVRVIQTDGEHLSNKQAPELNPRPLERKEFLFESCDCDLLLLDSADLRSRPLTERRKLVERPLKKLWRISNSPRELTGKKGRASRSNKAVSARRPDYHFANYLAEVVARCLASLLGLSINIAFARQRRCSSRRIF